MNAAEDWSGVLQQVICGDLAEDDPRVALALGSVPALRAELAALRAAQAEWSALAEDADELAATTAPTAADRALLAAALQPAPARGRWRIPAGLLAAAALLVAVFLFLRPQPVRPDGVLGGGDAVLVRQVGDDLQVHIREQLPPGESYHLRLEIDGAVAETAVSESAEWTFPPAWRRALAAATTARLVVEYGDQGGLAVVRAVSLK
jgi:hypothetical protein